MILFRVVQGAAAAIMFPAALGIVVAAFPVVERGKAMAIFFAVTGGLTSIGPLAGGYLTSVSWRAIFWVNVPVAIIALVLTARSRPSNERHPAPLDLRGAALICAGMGLVVLGLQQSSAWGWGDPVTWTAIAGGLALLLAFVIYELRVPEPLIRVRSSVTADSRLTTECSSSSRWCSSALFLRQPLRPAGARPERGGGRPVPADLLLGLCSPRPSSEGGSSTAAAPAPRSCRAAFSRRPASRSGPGACRPRTSTTSGRSSSSPAPVSA
jgi:MFS family permease